jgi:hypothetical protein
LIVALAYRAASRARHFASPTFQLSAFGPNAGGWSSDDTYPRKLADITGDGKADIIGFGSTGVSTSPFGLSASTMAAGGDSPSKSTQSSLEDKSVAPGATLELGAAYSGRVTFTGDTGTLKLDNSSSFAGTVAGMSGQDTIDFADIDPTKVQQPTYSGTASGGTLTVTDGSHTANIALLGNYLASTFVTSSDGHGGTNVVDPSAIETSQTALLVQPHHA